MAESPPLGNDPHPPVWRMTRGEARVYLVGGTAPGVERWNSPPIEELVSGCSVLWTETPSIGPEAQALAVQYGIRPGAPLETQVDTATFERAKAAAEKFGVALPLLSLMRPWLAAQVLESAAHAAHARLPQNTADAVLVELALEQGIPVEHEFPTAEAVIAAMGALPERAGIDYLSWALEQIELAPEDAAQRDARRMAGDLRWDEDEAVRVAEIYPDLTQHFLLPRNEAWIPRIERLLGHNSVALLVIGLGHLVGPGSVIRSLAADGYGPERV